MLNLATDCMADRAGDKAPIGPINAGISINSEPQKPIVISSPEVQYLKPVGTFNTIKTNTSNTLLKRMINTSYYQPYNNYHDNNWLNNHPNGTINYAPYFHLGKISVSTGGSGSMSGPDCGLAREEFIVNGESAADGSQPWMAAIYYNDHHKGSAVIVNKWSLITAAHIFKNVNRDIEGYVIKVGSNNRHDGKAYQLSKIIMHPSYNFYTEWETDIAMIKVREQIEMNPATQPVCLPTTPFEEPLNGSVIVPGWGYPNFKTKTSSDDLQVIQLDLYPIEKCAQKWQHTYKLYRSQLCTFNLNKDACLADSGGPAIQYMKGRATIVGIVSYGYECADNKHPAITCNTIKIITSNTLLKRTLNSSYYHLHNIDHDESEAENHHTGATNYAPYFHLGKISVSTSESVSISGPDCGLAREDFIVNGESAADGSQPWMAVVYHDDTHMGSAAIVNQWWLITAAHVFDNPYPHDGYVIRVGSNNRYHGQAYKLSEIYMHPKYNKTGYLEQDIAMIKVRTPIELNPLTQPVCLPTTPFEEPLNGSVTVPGWGYPGDKIRISSVDLQVVQLDLYPIEKCAQKYKHQGAKLYRSQLCTFNLNKDACQADSGGPAIQYIKGKGTIVGIVSYGDGCADNEHPGWIQIGVENHNAGATNYAPYFHLGKISVSTGGSGSISGPDCGLAREDFIVNGESAADGSQPWMAAVYHNDHHLGSAAIVNQWWLISAAHVFNTPYSHEGYVIRVGSNNRYHGKGYKLSEINNHPKFNVTGDIENDIAMIKVRTPIELNPITQPVCLPTTPFEEPLNGSVTVPGWGYPSDNIRNSPVDLQVIQLDLYPIEKLILVVQQFNI
ncbi:unnamed protein product [Medioppia subpectinata]|uniref:Peptidase S1 domain-containing protein n=1 Tax=Medioppia subpectinata TaxID=1979941 RepID=A0A7R9KJB7_9ACAR|nr:unnamed protein product [Medioppia subpectinata]CAG2103230.1 unnamed protein product [Medioppia subpectinata]